MMSLRIITDFNQYLWVYWALMLHQQLQSAEKQFSKEV